MNEVNTTALFERVKRLERQNKLIKLAGIVVVLSMTFMLFGGAKEKVPKEIVAEKFRVVDTQGRTRALLSAGPEGPILSLLDENGETRAALSVPQEGSLLRLYDENGKPRAGLVVLPLGPELLLWDKRGEIRADLAILKGNSALELYDLNGKTVFSAP